MATSVTVEVSGGAKADCAISGGHDSIVTSSETFSIGKSGSTITMLTVKQVGKGKVKVRTKGKVYVDTSPKTSKKISNGSYTLGKEGRVTVREQ